MYLSFNFIDYLIIIIIFKYIIFKSDYYVIDDLIMKFLIFYYLLKREKLCYRVLKGIIYIWKKYVFVTLTKMFNEIFW